MYNNKHVQTTVNCEKHLDPFRVIPTHVSGGTYTFHLVSMWVRKIVLGSRLSYYFHSIRVSKQLAKMWEMVCFYKKWMERRLKHKRSNFEPQWLYYSGHHQFHAINAQVIIVNRGEVRFVERGFNSISYRRWVTGKNLTSTLPKNLADGDKWQVTESVYFIFI